MLSMRILAAFLGTMMLASCSTTPGDAANRAGHTTHAADLYRIGASQGDALAAFKLGRMVQNQQITFSQYGPAGMWFVRACELGDTVGCHNAGVGFEYGPEETLGLEKDLAKAREFYQKAAESGYMQSQYNLGSLYANRYFENDIEGLKWLLVSQKKALECSADPLCAWVLEDPPGHIARLRERMSGEGQALAERQASEWNVKE